MYQSVERSVPWAREGLVHTTGPSAATRVSGGGTTWLQTLQRRANGSAGARASRGFREMLERAPAPAGVPAAPVQRTKKLASSKASDDAPKKNRARKVKRGGIQKVVLVPRGKQRGGNGGEKDDRPGFTTDAKRGAVLWHNTRPNPSFVVNTAKPNLPWHNAAMPHRMSWKDIRDSTSRFHDRSENSADFRRWTGRFVEAGEERIAGLEVEIAAAGKSDSAAQLRELLKRVKASQAAFVEARDTYAVSGGLADKLQFLKQANSFHANVPDLGPHNGVNNPVREAGHLRFVERPGGHGRTPSPMSRRVLALSPERLSTGLAFADNERLITTTGETISRGEMSEATRKAVDRFPRKVISSFDPNAPFGPGAGSTSTSAPKKSQPRKSPAGKQSAQSRRRKKTR
jgi:hypothetical protein